MKLKGHSGFQSALRKLLPAFDDLSSFIIANNAKLGTAHYDEMQQLRSRLEHQRQYYESKINDLNLHCEGCKNDTEEVKKTLDVVNSNYDITIGELNATTSQLKDSQKDLEKAINEIEHLRSVVESKTIETQKCVEQSVLQVRELQEIIKHKDLVLVQKDELEEELRQKYQSKLSECDKLKQELKAIRASKTCTSKVSKRKNAKLKEDEKIQNPKIHSSNKVELNSKKQQRSSTSIKPNKRASD